MPTLAPSPPGAGRESTGITGEIAPRPSAPRRAAGRARRLRQRLVVLSFIGPTLVGLAVFFVYPLVAAIYFSFTRFDLVNKPTWVGLQNWRFLLEDINVRDAAKNTIWFVVVMVPARIAFA